MALNYLCGAALNKADVLLHFPTRPLTPAFKFENPGVKFHFTNSAEDQICRAWAATIKMALTIEEWLSRSVRAVKKQLQSSCCLAPMWQPLQLQQSLIVYFILYAVNKLQSTVNCVVGHMFIPHDTRGRYSLLFLWMTFPSSKPTSRPLLRCSVAHFILIPNPAITVQMKTCVIGWAPDAQRRKMTLLFVRGACQWCSNASSIITG